MTSVKKIKVALLALVAALVIAIPTSAFAVGDITLTSETTGDKYSAYQVFTGTLDSEGKLGNIEWATGIDSAGLISDLKTKEGFTTLTDASTAQDVAKLLGAVAGTTDPALAQTFAAVAADHLDSAAEKTLTPNGKTHTVSNLADGYWIVVQTEVGTGDKGQTGTYSRYIITVAGADVTAEAKAGVPEVDKKVAEDSQNNNTEDPHNVTNWGKAADYQLGQKIPYQIKGTLPDNYADYKTYWYKFTDQMDPGLTYQNDVKVYANGVDVTQYFDIKTPTAVTAGAKLEIGITNMKSIPESLVKIDKSTSITVEYTCVLNENAVRGVPGNNNNVYLEYSNNPNKDNGGDTPGKTPEKWCVVFTYDADVTKYGVDGASRTPLADAQFKVYNSENKYYKNVNNVVTWVDENDADVFTSANGTGTFNIEGLDAGTYTIKETVTPAGYNTMAPKSFTIDGDGNVKWQGINNEYDGSVVQATAILEEVQNSSGHVEIELDNVKGTGLPSTGGIGTTIFTIVGIALIVAAAAIMVVRRRAAVQQ